MSSPRLVPVVALAAAALALPASASAALTADSPYPAPDAAYGTHLDDSGTPVVNWTADNILGPNEDINVSFPLNDDGLDDSGGPLSFEGGTGLLTRTDNSDVSISPSTTTRQFGASAPNGGFTTNDPSAGGNGYYQLHTGGSLVCGTNVGLKLDMSSVSQAAFNKSYTYTLPTGVHGAYRRNPSDDIGQVVTDGGTIQSKVDVAGHDGLAKGIRVHIGSIEHRFSTFWLEITLISPSGKKVVLMDHQGSLDANTALRPKSLTNVTFSDSAVSGQVPKDATDALAAAYTNIVMKPKESLASLDGEPINGNWKLQVHDIPGLLSNRSSRGRSYAFSGNEMAQVGDWQLDTSHALCSGAPDAWFGSPGQLVLDPAGGTLDASASYDPSTGGSIATYNWDLDGNPNTGLNGFEVSTSTPTVPYGAVTSAPYTRDIKLQVIDNQGNTSPTVTRTVIFSNKPVIAPVTINPTTPIANQQATLTASATDSDVGDTLTYSWDLDGDGSYGDASGTTATHTWANSGPQVIRIKVTDSRGAVSYSWTTISIANTNPVARLTYRPTPAVVGQLVTLDGSTSTDVDGTIDDYTWDLDGNGTLDDVVGQSPTTTTTFTSPGEHIVRMVAIDNTGGKDTVELAIWVTGAPVGVVGATPSSPLVGETVTFSGAQSHDSDPGGSIANYEWDLDGNGSYEVSGATAVSATKSYPNAGTVSVRLRLTDNDGATSVTPFALTVRSPVVVTPAPTPKPVATPTPTPAPVGQKAPDVAITGGGTIKAPVVQGAEATDGTAWWDGSTDSGETPNAINDGFAASLGAAAKQPGKKAYKTGVAVALTASAPGKIAVKATIDGKTAKKLGIATKAKVLSIGAGTLTLKKAGKGKFYVRFNKKYAVKVRKAKALTVMLRGLVTSADGKKVAVSRKVTILK